MVPGNQQLQREDGIEFYNVLLLPPGGEEEEEVLLQSIYVYISCKQRSDIPPPISLLSSPVFVSCICSVLFIQSWAEARQFSRLYMTLFAERNNCRWLHFTLTLIKVACQPLPKEGLFVFKTPTSRGRGGWGQTFHNKNA